MVRNRRLAQASMSVFPAVAGKGYPKERSMPSDKEKLFTAEELREAMSYNPKTGTFFWRYRPGWKWNTRLVGKRAGYDNKKGIAHRHPYRLIWFKGTNRKEHQLAWLWMTGQWPSKNIDHKDGNGLNNKWSNLRLATVAQNTANSKMYSTNTVGFKGVQRNKRRFQARIIVDGKFHHLGMFATAEEAHDAYVKAAKKHFGEFARAE